MNPTYNERHVEIFLYLIKDHVGAGRAISGRKIAREWFGDIVGASENYPYIRALVHDVRTHRLIRGLCGNGRGYFLAKNPEELMEYTLAFRRRQRSMEAPIHGLEDDLSEWIAEKGER